MGVQFLPRFDAPLFENGFGSDGKLLARELDALDRVAHSAGVPALSAFMDHRPAPDIDPDDLALELTLEAWQAESDAWFPAADGLQSVEGILSALKADSSKVTPPEVREELIGVLESAANCFRRAASEGARFRFEILA